MYPWVVTWNPVGGECFHNCEYCYRNDMMQLPPVKNKYSGEPRYIDESVPSEKNKIVFVCSMTDLFAEEMPEKIIKKVLQKSRNHPNQKFLFQSKNPMRFNEFIDLFPENFVLGTTIESDKDYGLSNAPKPSERWWALSRYSDCEVMVSIEPILDFGLENLVSMIKDLHPEFVSIGADSKGKNLSEPDWKKVKKLIGKLEDFTEIREKKNLGRLKSTT